MMMCIEKSGQLRRKFGTILLIISLMLFGIYLRIPSNPRPDLNMDEAGHVHIASADSIGKVIKYSLFELHPPLFYIALHYWMLISHDLSFMHCLPLLMGTALIPLYYFIGNRIGGKACGICCAAFVTLSHGCILQSFSIRQYGIMLLMLSLSLYYFILWCENNGRKFLIIYTIFGLLACFSEFSAIFYFFCLTLFGGSGLHKKNEKKFIIEWLAANGTIAVFAISVYLFWQPAIFAYKPYFTYFHAFPANGYSLFSYAMSAPIVALMYLSPVFLLLLMLIFITGKRISSTRLRRAANSYLVLAYIACFMAVYLYLFKIYSMLGGRQSLWMLPLILPAIGLVISEWTKQIIVSRRWKYGAALIFLVSTIVFFDIKERAVDRGELGNWSLSEKENISIFLNTLGKHTVIDAPRVDVSMFSDPYPYMNYTISAETSMAAMAPYKDKYFLFNPYYANDYSANLMLLTLRDAINRHLLDDVDHIAFLEEPWRAPVQDLALCSQLEKQIVSFPPFAYNKILTQKDLGSRPVIIVISKKAIEDDVLAVNGKARPCLTTLPDMVKDLGRP